MLLCFIDTETTGLSPGRLAHEVAMIRREEGGEETEVSFFVDVDLSAAEPKALEVGRFYERHPYGQYLSNRRRLAPAYSDTQVGGYLPPRIAAPEVARMTHRAHLVGAVPSFDAETLAALLRRHELAPAWHHRLRCVESLTAGHLGREVGGLRRCAEALGIEVNPEAEHTALGDARMARAIWDLVVKP
jgi:DNA polymerase III epsilon subunit-like protein